MPTKSLFRFATLFFLCACICNVLTLTARAEGDDEDNNEDSDNAIRVAIQGPVQQVNCTATPPTVQILGLTIDVSKLVVNNSNTSTSTSTATSTSTSTSTSTATSTSTSAKTTRDHGDDDQGDDDNQGDEDGGDEGGGHHGTPCDSIVGLTVRLGLASDQAPLQAINGQLVGGYNSAIFVQGPVQAIDTSSGTITVLGLTILTSNGNASGSLVNLSTLMVGDQVTAFLKSDQPPLQAIFIKVKHQDNGILLNLSGNDDGDDKDCEIDEVVTAPVNTTPTGSLTSTAPTTTTATTKGKTKTQRKLYHFKKTIKGSASSVSLRGLPAGRAKITVKKGNKVLGRKSVTIAPNSTQTVDVKLHSSKSAKN